MSDGTKDILVAAMLPDNPTLSAISQIIGEPLAMQLADKCCGERVHIPQPQSIHRANLSTVIGVEATAKVAAVYGGMQVEVPVRIGRRCAIARLILLGLTPSEIVKTLFVHRRSVYLVNNLLEVDGVGGLFAIPVNVNKNQLSLFPDDE